ncbi:MFS transporter [Cellulosimicrobium protaetiae]|uniref:MFS transporter n=1 Tax=Cellulosimicrobium protaetiae TaxID=2587808 RepID=A0A6M5UJ40_9MICO|nr:MFS transporter [Cellulosimicrobium protaetiae]QJW37231.1 MFS transporter [Cellulosimicrobium protaetiae]
MTNATTAPRLSRATIAGYAAGSVGTGGFGTLPGLVLLVYLTDALAVPAAAAGLIVTGAKVWDVVIDPFIGYGSDRDLARTGSRRRFMTIGALTLPVLFALTFAVPSAAGPTAAAIWVLVAFLLAATAFSLFQVPYIALPAELDPTYDGRTRLLAWRVAALAFAILLFGAGGPALRGGGDSTSGYLVMGVVSGVVIGAGMLVASRVAPRVAPRRPGARDGGAPGGSTAPAPAASTSAARAWVLAVREAVDALRRSRPFRTLLAAFFLQAVATGLMLAGAAYVARYVLHDEAAVSFLFAALIAPALLCMPLWTRLARRDGKERGFVVATVLFAVAALGMIPLLWAPGAWVYAPTALAGIAYAGMQALPLAMLPDVIAHDARTHGEGRGGAFSGVWTAGETTGMALGAAVLSLVLGVTGYVSTRAGETVAQPVAAVDGIALSFSVVPAVLVLVSLVPLVRYGLRKGDIDDTAPELPRDHAPTDRAHD